MLPLSLALCAILCSGLAQDDGRPIEGSAPAAGARSGPGARGPGVVARGRGLELSGSELDPVLLERFAMSSQGREVLKLLLQSAVIERIAQERGLVVREEEIDALWNELDAKARASGESEGLAAEIRRSGLGPGEFRDYLRLSILQERLTREALGIPEGREVSGERQELWLGQEMVERGLAWPPPPWADRVAARCGDVEVRAEELARTLRVRLPRRDVEETCWHLLLRKGIRKRMPDLSPEARERAIDEEMARRRRQAEQAANVEGLTFEELLGARGSSVEALRSDPSVEIAALSRLWVDRTAGPDGLREAYESERATFEGRFGKAVRTHLLFLTAARYVNELNPRTFEMAEDELRRLAEEAGNTDDFAALASRYSEDPASRQTGGDLGWVQRLDPRVPREIPNAIFEHLDTGGKVPATGRALEPVRLESGVGLLWISGVRESPPWEVMSEHVHEELRRRFLEDVLPGRDVEILLFGS